MAVIYPEGNTLSLRQQALERVREMQRRAQIMADGGEDLLSHTENTVPAPAPPTMENNGGQKFYRQPERQSSFAPKGIADLPKGYGLGDKFGGLGDSLQSTVSSVSQPMSQLLESFGIDGEKLIILMVMWAVFNQHKENKTLLMALGYLLL